MKRKIHTLISAATLPVIASGLFLARTAGAQTFASGSFGGLVGSLVSFLGKTIMPIFIAIAVLIFFGNMVFFIWKSDNAAEREKFKTYSVNAIIGLFILLCVWGIIGVATHTFGFGLAIPQLPTSGS